MLWGQASACCHTLKPVLLPAFQHQRRFINVGSHALLAAPGGSTTSCAPRQLPRRLLHSVT